MLEQYFGGYSVDTLKPLLVHSDYIVQKVAVWIASELGAQASPLVQDVVPLLSSDDRYLIYHALEIVAVCGSHTADLFQEVFYQLKSEDEVLRKLAMTLIGNTSPITVGRIVKGMDDSSKNRQHVEFLNLYVDSKLLDKSKMIKQLLHGSSFLGQRYGAIMARWEMSSRSELIVDAGFSENKDVQRYAQSVIDVHEL